MQKLQTIKLTSPSLKGGMVLLLSLAASLPLLVTPLQGNSFLV